MTKTKKIKLDKNKVFVKIMSFLWKKELTLKIRNILRHFFLFNTNSTVHNTSKLVLKNILEFNS